MNSFFLPRICQLKSTFYFHVLSSLLHTSRGKYTLGFITLMRWTTWYHFYNLKNVKNTHGGVLLSRFLHCTESISQQIEFVRTVSNRFMLCFLYSLPRIFLATFFYDGFAGISVAPKTSKSCKPKFPEKHTKMTASNLYTNRTLIFFQSSLQFLM